MFAPLKAILRFSGFALLLILLVPLHALDRRLISRDPHRMPLLFYRLVSHLFGLHIRVHGAPSNERPTLFVSNHTSYLDIFVLGALLPAYFVAKAEVARWPIIGLLAQRQGTVFVERRASRARNQQDEISQRLCQGGNVILFPEGTSSEGTRVLPFKSSLFSVADSCAAQGQPLSIQPLTVLCTGLNGLPAIRSLRPFYAWFGDMTLPDHLVRVLSQSSFTIDVIFHPPVTRADFTDRKQLAEHCQNLVNAGVEQLNRGRLTVSAATAQKQLAANGPDLA